MNVASKTTIVTLRPNIYKKNKQKNTLGQIDSKTEFICIIKLTMLNLTIHID